MKISAFYLGSKSVLEKKLIFLVEKSYVESFHVFCNFEEKVGIVNF